MPNYQSYRGSVYDKYAACPTCGQKAGQPCIAQQRMYPTHMKSVHPNRPKIDNNGVRSYINPMKYRRKSER